jgi:hypothetical protein
MNSKRNHSNPVLLLGFVVRLLPIMNLKIISWNVRGLNDAGKRVGISNLLENWKPGVMCFFKK